MNSTTNSGSSPEAKKPDTKVTKRKQPKIHSYPFWSPRFWHGMRAGDWWKLCIKHGFRIHPIRWPMAVLLGMITPVNSILRLWQRAQYGSRIDRTRIEEPPVFIIGHWRSGTTFLHEVMHQDERFYSPTTYQCFAPHHFLLTEWLIAGYGGWLMPRQRPMDNMATGWERPQEDEFALLTLGAPTPYLRCAFPNDPPPAVEFLDMEGVDPADKKKFSEAMIEFSKLITFRSQKQLLLKSPPHTGRIELLSKLFPGARFIHIVRNPYSLFSSTVRLWQSLDAVQSLQMPKHKGLEEFVLMCLTRMYQGYEKQRAKIDPAMIVEVKYEDLVKSPMTELERIYGALKLPSIEGAKPKIEKFLTEQKDYQTNKHELDEESRKLVREHWGFYFDKYGYEK